MIKVQPCWNIEGEFEFMYCVGWVLIQLHTDIFIHIHLYNECLLVKLFRRATVL